MSDPIPETFIPTMTQRARLLVTGHPVYAVSAAVPTLSYYGGATVTRAHDANKRLYTVLCARNLNLNAFGLYSLCDGVAQQIAPLVSGRGSIWVSLVDGTAEWVGFPGSAPPLGGPIPGFAPLALGGKPGPPGPPGPPGSGGVTLFETPYLSPEWDNRVLTAGVLVDIPSVFGCPAASTYLVRFCAVASAANVRARIGTQAAPFLFTINTPAGGVDVDGQGLIPGPSCYISPARGTPNVWLQIIGCA